MNANIMNTQIFYYIKQVRPQLSLKVTKGNFYVTIIGFKAKHFQFVYKVKMVWLSVACSTYLNLYTSYTQKIIDRQSDRYKDRQVERQIDN